MKLLAVSHDASRSGAPTSLLHFCQWLRDRDAAAVETVLLRDGPLTPDFRGLGPVHRAGTARGRSPGEVVTVGLERLGADRLAAATEHWRVCRAVAGGRSADLVLLNTVASCVALRCPVRGPVVCWAHELANVTRRALPERDQARAAQRVDRWVAITPAVADHLHGDLGVPRERVAVVPDFIPMGPAGGAGDDGLRTELGLMPGDRVVGSMGEGSWRKGIDAFVRVAGAVGRDDPSAHFVWVGPVHDRGQVLHDAHRLGVEARVHLVGERPDAAAWHQLFDVYVLTSREEPQSLAVLEAAAAGTPVVAFDAGAAVDFVSGSGGGVAVGYLDVDAMSAAVASLLADPGERRRLGRAGAAWVGAHHDLDDVAARLLAELERVM